MSDWLWTYDDRSPARESVRETLCTLGNGYVATRGAAEEYGGGDRHYPGTYLAGGYDRLAGESGGQAVEQERLVNWPNWLPLTFRPADGAWLDPDRWTLLEHRWTLDLHRGVLVRRLRVRDPEGRVTALRSRRLVHMGNRNLLAIEWELTPENWSGPLVVRTALDGAVTNAGTARERTLPGQHLQVVTTGAPGHGVIELLARSAQSHLMVALAARTRAFAGHRQLPVERHVVSQADAIAEELHLSTGPGRTLRIEKVVAVFTSRDHAISEPLVEARRLAGRAPAFDELLRTQMLAWKRLWSRCDVEIAGPPGAQRLLRLHLFHLLQTTSPHATDLDVGVPARGWSGEAYRGLVSWDELFVLPLLQHAIPEVARALLMYRVRRLGEARARAEELGLRGAIYPWQSGSSGREEASAWRLDAARGRWLPDPARRQFHVSSAVAYGIWQYYLATNDVEFLSYYGAEVLLEIARAWAALAEHDAATDRFSLRGVVGPDLFHDHYHGAERPGVDDDSYTTLLAAWVLRCAEELLDVLPPDRRVELCDQLEITDAELAHWRHVGRRLHVPFLDGFPAPFTGYEALPELDWASYAARFGELHHLDWILAEEGDSAARYRAASLAGSVVLLHLFRAEELDALLDRLGYDFDPAAAAPALRFHLERTAPGSALGRALRAWVLARDDRAGSWPLLEETLRSHVQGVPQGATGEGIHLAAMAVAVDLVRRCWLGLEMRDGMLWLDPQLPREVDSLCTNLRHHGSWIEVRLGRDELTLTLRDGPARTARVGVGGQVLELAQGEGHRVPLAHGVAEARLATA